MATTAQIALIEQMKTERILPADFDGAKTHEGGSVTFQMWSKNPITGRGKHFLSTSAAGWALFTGQGDSSQASNSDIQALINILRQLPLATDAADAEVVSDATRRARNAALRGA